MRYLALACDYDGTLAHSGVVAEETISALTYLRSSGRKLLMVTGRRLDDLARIFPPLELFDRVVAENGALLYRPATREEVALAEPPPAALVAALRERGVTPLAVGRTIVATFTPHDGAVLEAIRTLGLELQVIFNKGAVMVLPSGVNKATGLAAALLELGLSARNVVGVGDAENDHAFLSACECGVAVANALPLLKERADFVTAGDHGAGVVELVTRLVDDDLADVALPRHRLALGAASRRHARDARSVRQQRPARGHVRQRQVDVRDETARAPAGRRPAVLRRRSGGRLSGAPGARGAGRPDGVPTAEEVLDVLARPDQSAVVSLLGLKIEQRRRSSSAS
jgi:HAD superfamily hydrolase (TIGR01484 family)